MSAVAKVHFEIEAVALTLACVLRLQQAFNESSSQQQRHCLLTAAGDFMDRTVPGPALRESLKKQPQNPLPLLIERRNEIAPIPPMLWRKSRIAPMELGPQHYAGVKAALRWLRHEVTRPDLNGAALREWLAPVLEAQPELSQELSECLGADV